MGEANWREMEVGRELDWLIAEKCGVEILEQTPNTDWNTTHQPMYLAKIDGALQGLWHSRKEDCAPRYSSDLNAAFDLLKQMPMGAVGLLEGNEAWFSNAYMDGAGLLTDEEADTPALAICRAWLAWKERQS